MEYRNSFTQEVLDKITEEEILNIIYEITKEKPFKIKEKEIWFSTVCHGGDSHKLCYFRESKDFYCYTNCGKMNLFSFIMNIRNCSFKEALSFLGARVGLRKRQGISSNISPFLKEEQSFLERRKKNRQGTSKIFKANPIPIIEDSILNYFEPVYYLGWIEEGITIETMQKYNIRWYEARKHIIIPHYNIYGQLVGIRRRTLNEEEIPYGKYMPESVWDKYDGSVEFAHSLGLNLYGLNHTKKAIKQSKTVIVVEGEKSVLLSDSYFGDNSIAIATCGFTISNWQRDILLKLGIDEIVIAFDKDFNPLDFEGKEEQLKNTNEYKKYERFCDRLINIGEKFAPYCKVTIIWDRENLLDIKDSPFDKGKEIFERLYKEREEINMRLLN